MADGFGVALSVLGITLLAAAFIIPIRCHGPTSKRPYPGCRRTVHGLLGACRYHGRKPKRRLLAILGGDRLTQRLVCDRCGQPTTFLRMKDTGAPYLGCAGYPNCKNPRLLKTYTF
jgi:hypothetical protein